MTSTVDTASPTSELSVAPAEPNGNDGWYTVAPEIALSTGEEETVIYYRWGCPDGDFALYSGAFVADDGERTPHYFTAAVIEITVTLGRPLSRARFCGKYGL